MNRLKLATLLGMGIFYAGVQNSRNPRSGWPGPVVWHGPTGTNEVALTFDDGPHTTATPQIREILAAYGVKANFFAVGRAVDAAPGVVEGLLKDDHLVGSHSYSHRWQDAWPLRYDEVDLADDAFRRHFGLSPAFYRPPHGIHSLGIAHAVRQHDMTLVTWDVMATDWSEKDPEVVSQRILSGAKPGSIILLHDGSSGRMDTDRSVVVKALPTILEGLNRRGLEPVRLDRMLGIQPYA